MESNRRQMNENRTNTEMNSAKPELLFAPMEGITYAAFRTFHQKFFPGASEYFTPFIAPDKSGAIKKKYLKELTDGYPSVPQLLVNHADAFNIVAWKLYDLGFREINLNTGCPSATVYAKHKGAGMLRNLDSLAQILEAVFDQAERLGYHDSIKTRMGDHSTSEFPEILSVYSRFPLSRLIVHARCRDDFYRGTVDVPGFRKARELCRFPLVYNGDIRSEADLHHLVKSTRPESVMIGRGAVTNPALFRELSGGGRLKSAELQDFLEGLTEIWTESGLSPKFAMERMKTLWTYMKDLFPDEKKLIKSILKSNTMEEYKASVSVLLRSREPSGIHRNDQSAFK